MRPLQIRASKAIMLVQALLLGTVMLQCIPCDGKNNPMGPNSIWAQAANEYGLDPVLLLAVALMESQHAAKGINGYIAPHPYALNAPSGPVYANSKQEALEHLHKLRTEHGDRRVDAGMMQLNLHWNGKKFGTISDIFSPLENLRVAAGVLRDAVLSAPGDWELGIGRYHHWADESRSRKYGRRVLRIYWGLRDLNSGAH